MSLTHEQIEREREAFEAQPNYTAFARFEGGRYVCRETEHRWKGYLARAEVAEAERVQRDKALQHVIDEIAGQLRVGALKDEPFNGKIYWRQIIGVCQQALGLDAILAQREKGGAK